MESDDELSRRPPPIYDEGEEEDQTDRPNRRTKARKAKRSPKVSQIVSLEEKLTFFPAQTTIEEGIVFEL